MRVLIVDDEPLAVRRMMICLQSFPGVTVAGTCENGQVALKAIEEKKPDIVLLDVRMPVMDGFALMDRFGDESGPLIIIVTAHNDFAVRAFDANVIDYILKPVESERLGRALERARNFIERRERASQTDELWSLIRDFREGRDTDITARVSRLQQWSNSHEDSIWIKDRGKISRVDIIRIEWIRAVRDYVCVFVPEKTYLVRETMKNLEERLDPAIFLRVHRSAIVNRSMVRELRFTSTGGHLLVMNSGEEIRVGRTYSPMISRYFTRQVMA